MLSIPGRRQSAYRKERGNKALYRELRYRLSSLTSCLIYPAVFDEIVWNKLDERLTDGIRGWEEENFDIWVSFEKNGSVV